MNKSMKRLCVLVASALSMANVNNSQAMNMKKCNVQKFQYINGKLSNMLENEIENNNEINNTYRPGPSKNSLIRRSNSNEIENENNTGKYENLILEQGDSFTINSNNSNDDGIIYNDDYNNGTAEESYYPGPDEPEFTKEELEEMLKSNEKSSIVDQGDIVDDVGFPFDGFNINQSDINNEFLPEYQSPDEIIEYENNFGNNASMQNNNNSPDYAQVIKIPHTAENAYAKCFAMTSKDFGKQLRNYNKNEYDRTVDDLVALGNNPNFKVGYYSINLSEYPNPISVCFVAMVYDNIDGSWKNYIFKNHSEITRNLSGFDNNVGWAVRNEINRLAEYGSESFITFDIDKQHGISRKTGGFTLVSRID